MTKYYNTFTVNDRHNEQTFVSRSADIIKRITCCDLYSLYTLRLRQNLFLPIYVRLLFQIIIPIHCYLIKLFDIVLSVLLT